MKPAQNSALLGAAGFYSHPAKLKYSLTTLWKFFFIIFLKKKKKGFGISCESSPLERIHMKCQTLFS